MGIYEVDTLIEQTRLLAAEYRRTTGKPLPVTTEIANYDAARLLDLELISPPPGGYDAVGKSGEREGLRYQIKGRAIFDEKKGGQRLGQLKVDKEWDAILLVLLNDDYQPFSIYEASRDELDESLDESLQSRRSNRGAMSIARFKNISRLVWSEAEGEIEDRLWENSGN
ncbi:MAG: hypothetical protein OQK13_04890 [Gammaproteobacteria bacterium]|nr:hypothetical protein [Gammaproteobacteria bacterium]